jgi:putative membrane protein
MRTTRTTLIALILLATASAARADAAAEQFLVKAMQVSLVEMELGKLAQKNAESTGVNALGTRLARDHARIAKILAAVSRDRGVAVATALDGSHRSVIDSLRSKSGPEFDAAYSEQMVSDHEKAIALFTAVAESSDPQLSQLAKQLLPILREDRRLADSFEKLSEPADVRAVADAK